jgi:hypothetical protein
MRLTTITGALALCASAAAFSDTSPFMLLSTAKLEQSTPSDSDGGNSSPQQLMTGTVATQLAQGLLADCPTSRYLIVSQPHINAADLTTSEGACAVPNLYRAMGDSRLQTKVTVAEVFGTLSAEDMVGYVKTTCALKNKEAEIKQLALPALPVKSREQVLADNDYLLRGSIENLASADSYTIIYLAGHPESTYEAEFGEPVRMDLKKRIASAARHLRRDLASGNQQSLFDKYQFFTPGIFVSLVVAFILISILTAGLKGLASLAVPYGAYEKEMGPAAQKKQQH